MRAPLVAAHRGASYAAAGNSMAAFELAIAEGADLLETDVRETRDGVLVLHHDAALADGRLLHEHSLAEVSASVSGLVRLDELCAAIAGRSALDVELKTAGQEQQALAILDAHLPGWEVSTIITSFLDGVVSEVKGRRPGARVGLLVEDGGADGAIARCTAVDADLLAVEDALVDDDMLDAARRAGLPLVVWTVDDEERAAALASRREVETIITNRPAAIRGSIGAIVADRSGSD